jgi:hypothetical protein
MVVSLMMVIVEYLHDSPCYSFLSPGMQVCASYVYIHQGFIQFPLAAEVWHAFRSLNPGGNNEQTVFTWQKSKFGNHFKFAFNMLMHLHKFSLKIYCQSLVFWDVAPCSKVYVDRRFRGAYCLHYQGEFQWCVLPPLSGQ